MQLTSAFYNEIIKIVPPTMKSAFDGDLKTHVVYELKKVMDADPSMLGKQAGMLPQGYQNIKRGIHSWINNLLNVVAQRMTLKGKFFLFCRTVEKLLTIEAVYIRKLKPVLCTRDKYRGQELTLN